MITPIQHYIPVGTLRRSGQKILGVKFVVAHDTGNPNSTAAGNVGYFIQSANELEASAHTFVDDVSVIECIPLTEKAWHVVRNTPIDNQKFGVDANDYAIGVELCYFPGNLIRTQGAYDNYVDYIKGLCSKYNIDPLKFVVGHYQIDPKRKTDPMNAFNIINKTWEQFMEDLKPIVVVIIPEVIVPEKPPVIVVNPPVITENWFIKFIKEIIKKLLRYPS